ncbi:MAG: DUF3732 domain-containing protein [Bacteroidales bacterium]|nr:DUF3732 domain-containing protein [Bacteroidales bacterium]
MKFIIHEIKLWFKGGNNISKSYELLPNKVNVVTGDATTGKTSFWSIIDYCLMANKTNIANSINEKVAWYGIRFTINNNEISIARKATQKETASSEVYFGYGMLPSSPLANIEIAQVKSILDKEFGITDELRFPYGKDLGKVPFNLSYRHFLLFNSLTENIIGTSNTYFDTPFYGKEEYDKALTHIFDLVIGVNDMENSKAKERIKQIDDEIKKIYSREKRKNQSEKAFTKGIYALIEKLKEHELIEYSSEINSLDDAIRTIKELIANFKKTANNSTLFEEIDRLNKRRLEINMQLLAFDRYKKEYESYKRNLEKSADSLKPIEYLNKNLSDQLIESYETKTFIDSLECSLKSIQRELSKQKLKPLRTTIDIESLQKELSDIESRINKLNSIQQAYRTEGEKYIIIGEVKNAYESLLKKEDFNPIDGVRLNQLNDEKANLEHDLKNIDEVKYIMKNLLNKCIQRNYNRLESLPAYKNSQTLFNDTDMILQLVPEGQLFPLENVGSKSNYMFMHLCFYLGLHEHMINVGQIHVPQFLFIDQPSIPYYTGSSNEKTGNDDKKKLLDAFSLIDSFISYIITEKKATFQIFMVEHAPKEYWHENNLLNFHTVDEFINGDGLIPSDIYNE